ncbi:Alpha/Beta hydrolase protein [Pyronema omphalodes]|nr:Alpha/Beta hydrolase protein [Pyronema omphalodes]
MSSLQKQLQRSKLPGMPPPQLSALSIPESEEEESSVDNVPGSPLTDDSSSASSASSTGTIRPFFRPRQSRRKPPTTPTPWQNHFTTSLTLSHAGNSHHIYLTPPNGSGPLFICHHGAGSSGLSFAVLATHLRQSLPSAGILALDARAHGLTQTTNDRDLSLSTLTSDLLTVISLTLSHLNKLPNIVLVGHSLGGAVVVDAASQWRQAGIKAELLGYAVLDVVEGTAMSALTSMSKYLEGRPSGFDTEERAIEWHTTSSGPIRNLESARISVPALLKPIEGTAQATSSVKLIWRTDLGATREFWEGWFTGLSKKFLGNREAGKLLILTGAETLDKELLIAQMQGQFQLLVVPETGHFVMEDAPERCASALVEFYKRYDKSQLVLPPKIGEMVNGKPYMGM